MGSSAFLDPGAVVHGYVTHGYDPHVGTREKMNTSYPVIRVAAVQAAPVFLDRERTVQKACDLIREAGARGAKLVAFPENFIPGHCLWYHFHTIGGPISRDLATRLFLNSVEIPGPDVDALASAANEAATVVVIGVSERRHGALGTLYNTQLVIDSDGSIAGKHQKIMPTNGERIVYGLGSASTFGVINTTLGPISTLICGENSNPLAVFALASEGSRIHVMSWPPHLSPRSVPLSQRATLAAQAFSQMTKIPVVSVCGTLTDDIVESLSIPDGAGDFLSEDGTYGGSVITDANARVTAGPLAGREGILLGDVDLELSIRAKFSADITGHYNRPDIFQLSVADGEQGLYIRRREVQSAARPGHVSEAAPTPRDVAGDREAGPADSDGKR